MDSMDKIARLTKQYDKEMELARKYRSKADENAELAGKHEKKAEDLEKQIKYEKGEKVFDRVNALNLTSEELRLILDLLDDKTQLLDAIRKLYPEKIQNNGETVTDTGKNPDTREEAPETIVTKQDGDPDEEDFGNEEIPVYGEGSIDDEDEGIPVFGEDDDRRGEKIWSA